MSGQPAIWQQGFQGSRVARSDGCDPTQHVGQVRPHVHAVPSGTLHQRVQRRRRLAAHSQSYPGVTAWVAEVHQQALNTGEVRTLYGRRRYLPNIYSAYAADAAEARRHAVNTVVQGTAADMLKMALIRLHDTLPADVRMLLPVHDSVLLEVPVALVEETRRIVRDAMETLPEGFTVPLKIDIKAGKTWAECR